jgi:mRNA interferase YafQ
MKNYIVKYTTQFKKDYKLAKRRGLNIKLLQEIVKKLAMGKNLDDSYKDHALSGKWIGYRECHIQPDWLLIYHINKDVLVLTISRTGTHSDLFKK